MSPKTPLRGLLRLGHVTVDIARMHVVGRGDDGRLTPKLLAVLLRLAERPGDIVTRAELIASAWPGSHPTDDALSFAVRELRRALGDDARAPRLIETVHGVGYRIIADGVVREDPPQGAAAPADTAPRAGPVATDDVPSMLAPGPSPPEAGTARRWRRWAVAASVGALVVAFAATQRDTPATNGDAADAPTPSPVFVTSDAGAEEFPALSPDGAYVAYSSRATPTAFADIQIKRVDGPDAPAVALTHTSDATEVWPSWSPDGRWIAYQAHRTSGRAIMISAADGSQARAVLATELLVAGRMDWSADGRYLLASLPEDAPGRAPRLHLIDVQDGAIRRLRHDLDGSGWDLDPAYSPDGQWIAFRHGIAPEYDVFVMPATGGTARQLTHVGDVRSGVSWTADGRSVVFATDTGGRFSVFTVGLDDARMRPTGLVDAGSPHVARHAGRLAFQRPLLQLGMTRVGFRGDGAASPVATSTGSLRVFHSSPGRDRVVYLSDRGGPYQLWMHDAASGTDRAFDVHVRISSLRWTDDGQALLLAVRKDGMDHAMRLDVETGRLAELGFSRPVLRQLVDGGSPDRLFGLVQHGGQLQVARFDRDADRWRETTRGIMAHRLVRVPGTKGVYAHTLLDGGRIQRVDDDLSTSSFDIPLPIGAWTADKDGLWYLSASGTAQELRRYPFDPAGTLDAWPLPPGWLYVEIGIGFLGDDLLIGTVTADKSDIGVVKPFP